MFAILFSQPLIRTPFDPAGIQANTPFSNTLFTAMKLECLEVYAVSFDSMVEACALEWRCVPIDFGSVAVVDEGCTKGGASRCGIAKCCDVGRQV